LRIRVIIFLVLLSLSAGVYSQRGANADTGKKGNAPTRKDTAKKKVIGPLPDEFTTEEPTQKTQSRDTSKKKTVTGATHPIKPGVGRVVDSVRRVVPKPLVRKPPVPKPDTTSNIVNRPFNDTSTIGTDTVAVLQPAPPVMNTTPKRAVLKQSAPTYTLVFGRNKFVDVNEKATSFIISEREAPGKELLFYIIVGFLLLVGLCKVFYNKYVHNVFRVFFNTSLRQNQLTDILLHSTLASLIFNVLFTISAGIYLWFILLNDRSGYDKDIILLPFCVVLIMLIYIVKFIGLKFTAWLTGLQSAAEQYIFVIFLINKIIGFLLLPFIVLLAFAPAAWYPTLKLVSVLLIATLFVVRYFRTYGSLQNQLQVSPFHFMVYMAALEVAPLLVVYKLIIEGSKYLNHAYINSAFS
jgi:hypothetical protein